MNQYRRLSSVCHAALAVILAWQGAIGISLAAGGEHGTDAVEIFHCAFDKGWDENFDEWPDRWIRKSGSSYPHYVDIRIRDTDDPQASEGRYLEFSLDGASAAVVSPPIRVVSRFSYQFVTRLKTIGLNHSDVVVALDFYDAAGKLLQTESRRLATPSDGWHTVSPPTIDPSDAAIDRAVVRIEAHRSTRGDLQGKVCVDDVWLGRLPRITVTTNNPSNVYGNKDDVRVRCELSGIRERDPEIRFQLLDASGRELQGTRVKLDGQLIDEDSQNSADVMDGIGNAPKGYEGATEWRPEIPGDGYYSVVVRMVSSDARGTGSDAEREMAHRVIWLAVVPPLPMPSDGDFGWTLPGADRPLSFKQLTTLLPNVGINWVKIPAWYSPDNPQRGDEIIRFAEMLSASNIDVVGILDHPPEGSDLATRMGRDPSIADLFSFDPTIWMPSLDPVMSRLSMRLRYWQLGADSDIGLVGFPNLSKRIEELRSRLFRFGQEVKLGMPWLWDAANQLPSDASWEFEQLWPDPSLPFEEFERFVSQAKPENRLRWITIDPPPRVDESIPAQADLNARAALFVRKIIAAKQHGADAIFVSNPFDDKNGLMRENGMPAELLMPWRTCAAMLSGAEYLGTIQLPNGSQNRIFLRPDGQVVMVVWNAAPTRERLYLGRDVRQIDMWGQSTIPPTEDREQVIEVDTLPSFVMGLSEPIARWRMETQFEQDHVESIFGVAHANAIKFQNHFPQGAGGTISIAAARPQFDESNGDASASETRALDPDLWSIDPPHGTFSLSPGEAARFPFEIRLKNAIFGEQPVRVDFRVEADESYEFSVYRTMWIGTSDMTIDIKTHLDKEGTLVVQQIMTNNSDRLVDFKCSLRAKGHRPQKAQVYRLGATPDRKVYRFPNGAALVGQHLLLEAEEIGGQRVFKFLFVAKDEPPSKEDEQAERDGVENTSPAPRKLELN